jgi:hypothetical protein
MSTTPVRERRNHPSEPRPGLAPRAAAAFATWLAAHSVTGLRISLGLVIAGFGALKFIPGASPAEELVIQTTEALTFGAVTGTTAVVVTAALETFLGLTLLTGRGLRVGLVVMAGWLGGILAPVVLFPGEMFPGGFPTLAAQYVLKDIILAAAWAVLAAQVLGARLIPANLDDAVIRRNASGQPAGQPNQRGGRRAGDEHDQERRPHQEIPMPTYTDSAQTHRQSTQRSGK